jgi:hypothetical protein
MRAEIVAGRHGSEVAERRGISRPRVTQILNLLELDATVLEHLRQLPPGTPPRLVTEHRLRALLSLAPTEQLQQLR